MDITSSKEIYDSSSHGSLIIRELCSLWNYRELVSQFVARNLKTRYKRSALGVLWTFLNPLFTMLVLTLVFSSIFRFQVEHYPVYLLSGLLVWNFFSGSTFSAMSEIVWSGSLLQRIYVPKLVFPVSAIGAETVNLLISAALLLVISLVLGIAFTPALLTLPLALLILMTFSLGFGLLLSTAAVFFADLMPIYNVVVMIWMYGTPIFYPIEIIPEKIQWIFRLNPMYHMLTLIRAPLLNGVVADWRSWLYCSVIALLALLLGVWVFAAKSNDYAYKV